MIDPNNLLLFMAAGLALNLTPGPDMLYVIARSVGQGRAAGIASAFGIAAGCCVHILAVTFGLAGLMAAVPAVYEVVKYAGAGYLVYLGIRTLLARGHAQAETPVAEASPRRIFLQGVITNVLNPKVALFFLAFLPQFVDRTQGNVSAQLIVLGMLFNTSGTIVNVIMALAASHTGNQFKTRIGNSSVFRWLTGGIFIGLGLRLALLERK
ncbi:MAG TPA: LysE family translocator [Anaerolineales bacterium]|jgi:threonine/homoserine/homoserine lactone efflux protein